MASSPSCGVSCYEHQSMVMCNAHMLINNVLHDRLFGTDFARLNDTWMNTVLTNLLRESETGPLFYFGTEPNSSKPIRQKRRDWRRHLVSVLDERGRPRPGLQMVRKVASKHPKRRRYRVCRGCTLGEGDRILFQRNRHSLGLLPRPRIGR